MIAKPEVQMLDTRERLLQAAAQSFFAEGYQASMDGIAARAKVAKQTLYNHFTSKEALFREVVRVATQSILVSLEDTNSDLRSTLIRFAAAYRGATLSSSGIAIFRILMSEGRRFPTLARAVYTVGPGQTINQLAKFIEWNMANGDLRHDDPRFASEMLMGMLAGMERTRYLSGIEEPPGVIDEIKTERIIDSFLRAYAPTP